MGKEIIIDGSASDWFEKATFVIKETHMKALPKDLTRYAEEIIETHMKKTPLNRNVAPMSSRGTQGVSQYEQLNRAYEAQLRKEYEGIKEEKKRLKKRARYINTFVALSVTACIFSILALLYAQLG